MGDQESGPHQGYDEAVYGRHYDPYKDASLDLEKGMLSRFLSGSPETKIEKWVRRFCTIGLFVLLGVYLYAIN